MILTMQDYVRDIPDFPKEGIVYKDITPALKDSDTFREIVDAFYEQCKDLNLKAILGIESRGFIFGSALAYKLGVSLIPIRKQGKLPYKTLAQSYDLEYGTDTLEIHEDALNKGDRIVIVDDLLATGGTTAATAQLVERLGADIVKILYFIELEFLGGSKKLSGYDIFSILKY